MLKVSQNKKLFKVDQKAGDEHIEDVGGCLKIYVPMNKKAQDVSYGTTLPNRFAHWLMSDSLTEIQDSVHKDAIFALTLVMTMEKSALDRIFEHQGINYVPIPDEDGSSSAGEGVERDGTEEEVRIPQTEVSSVVDTPQDSGASEVGDGASTVETLVEEVSIRANNESWTSQYRSAMGAITTTGSANSRVDVIEDREHTLSSRHHANLAIDPTTLRSAAAAQEEAGHAGIPSTSSAQNTAAQNSTATLDSVFEDWPYELRGSLQAHLPHYRPPNVSHISTFAEEAEYRTLLNNIVVAARGATDPLPTVYRFLKSSQTRNCQTGAG